MLQSKLRVSAICGVHALDAHVLAAWRKSRFAGPYQLHSVCAALCGLRRDAHRHQDEEVLVLIE
jgi:hypothetical protein